MPDGLARFWAGLTMRDAIVAFLDIFIVYYGIYRVLLLIKGTRAAQMVFGLVLIAAGAAWSAWTTTVSIWPRLNVPGDVCAKAGPAARHAPAINRPE